MSGRHRVVPESPVLARARKRVAKLGDMDLLTHAEAIVSGAGRAFSDYAQHGQPESLMEIRDEALPALTAIVDELLLRDEAASS